MAALLRKLDLPPRFLKSATGAAGVDSVESIVTTDPKFEL